MNQLSRIIVLAAALVVLAPGAALAQAESVGFTMSAWQNVTGEPFPLGDACEQLGLPAGCIAPYSGGFMEHGEARCQKGTFTGNPMQPCSEPGGLHFRNGRLWSPCAMTLSTEPDDPVTVFMIFGTNANLAADYTGVTWGEMSLIFCDSDDDMPMFDGTEWVFCPSSGIVAVAEGIVYGSRELNASAYPGAFVTHIRFVAHGTEGLATGAMMKGQLDFYSFMPLPVIGYGMGDGTILFPPRKGHAK